MCASSVQCIKTSWLGIVQSWCDLRSYACNQYADLHHFVVSRIKSYFFLHAGSAWESGVLLGYCCRWICGFLWRCKAYQTSLEKVICSFSSRYDTLILLVATKAMVSKQGGLFPLQVLIGSSNSSLGVEWAGCYFSGAGGLHSFAHPTSQLKHMPRIGSQGQMCGSTFKVAANHASCTCHVISQWSINLDKRKNTSIVQCC